MRSTRRSLLVTAIVAVSPVSGLAQAQEPSPIIGRWTLTVDGVGYPACSWLEVQQSGNHTLVGRFVGWSGGARPISEVTFADGELRFAIPPQWEDGEGDLRVEGTLHDDALSGTMLDPADRRMTWTGRRAPALRRAAPPGWGSPIALFDGSDLSRWENPPANWRVVGGVLTNAESGGNLETRETFGDFKLHLEFKYPAKGNSGVYLRGRHEVQIEDSLAIRPVTERTGAIYGFLAPVEDASTGPDRWQTYDVTLIGRRVTVVLNGVTVISDREIPGVTGGALSCDEAAPGPLMLQGDHTAVEYRNIVLTPAK